MINWAPEVQREAKDALDKIDPDWPHSRPALEAVNRLIPHLTYSSANWTCPRGAAWALGCIGPQAATALPALIQALLHQDEGVCQAVEEALGKIDPDWAQSSSALQAIPALIQALEKYDHQPCRAARILGCIGPQAATATAALIHSLVHPDSAVRQAADEALGKIDPNWPQSPQALQAIAVLTQALGHRDFKVCHAAGIALGKIGPEAKSAVGVLVGLLAGRSRVRPLVGAWVLGCIGPGAAEAIPVLISSLGHASEEFRRMAEEALGKIDPDWQR
jgi:HEAT repeat protein